MRIKGWSENEYRIIPFQGDKKRSTVQEWILNKPSNPAITALSCAHVPKLLVSAKSTNTPVQSLNTTGLTSKIMATSQKSTGLKYPTLIFSQEDRRAKTYPLLVRELDSEGKEVDYFLNLCEQSKKRSRDILFGKTLKELYRATEAGILQQSSMKWPKQGILSGGKFSMPKTSVFLKTESVSLSSVSVMILDKYLKLI